MAVMRAVRLHVPSRQQRPPVELAEDGERPPSRPGRVLAALVLAVLGVALSQTSVVPVLPTLIKVFGTSASTITWVMTANLLSAAVCTPLLARIGDIRGRKPMMLVSLLGVAAGGVLAVATHSFPLLVLARVLQGTGGGVMPLAIAMIRDEMPREKVTGGVAIVSASLGIGSGLGLIATGAAAFINGAVPIDQAGIANGMNAVLRTVGGAVGTAVAGTILTGDMKQFAPGLSLPAQAAYQHTFAVVAILSVLAALIPLAIRTGQRHQDHQAEHAK